MPPVRSLAKYLGSYRAGFYRSLLKAMSKPASIVKDPEAIDKFLKAADGLPPEERSKLYKEMFNQMYRRPTVNEVTSMPGVKATKQDLKFIPDETFSNLRPTTGLTPAMDMYLMGDYIPNKRLLRVNPDYLSSSSKEDSAVVHELMHHNQNRRAGWELNWELLRSPQLREELEAEADEYASLVRKRAKGEIKPTDLPEKFRKLILSITGARLLDQGD